MQPGPFMLDTNIFNRVLDGKLPIEALHCRRGEIYATPVQHNELKDTKDEIRRSNLLAVFRLIGAVEKPIQSAVFGKHDTWNEAQNWGRSGKYYSKVKEALEARGCASSKSRGRIADALIAEVCLDQGFTLVTTDRDLHVVTENLGGKALCLDEFMALPSAVWNS